MSRKDDALKWRTSDKGKAYMTDYMKTQTKLVTIRCNKVHDADILAYLERLDNASGWLKKIIRREIDKGKRQ